MAMQARQAVAIELCWLANGVGLTVPKAQTAGAAGMDLQAAIPLGEFLSIPPHQWRLVPCGFAMALPEGYEAQIRPRSGLAAKFGITVLNSPGTIDADYRGELQVMLINHGDEPFDISRGDRIAQMIVAPVTQANFTCVDKLPTTKRGAGGHGSTGYKNG